ncbi:MAG: toast rack family protein [Methanospirillum sp.]|uniref:toast rack family protein n=1 Tax=Methanospirillum sp. TaxID=45200 RepID=UPI00236A0505|nr:toast rack family protein [Methanospirillum sp.]MDD1727566.1 toast rack family protein [Methanospirillum sp.]
MITGIRLPALRQVIIWLVIISVLSFSIGTAISILEKGSYRPIEQETVTPIQITPGDITHASINLKLDSGRINISAGGKENLISGVIEGRNAKNGPDLSYTSMGKVGYLNVTQESTLWFDPISKEDYWNLSLGQDVPTSLYIQIGSGDLVLRPGKTNLTDLSVNQGTGDLTIDLTEWRGAHLLSSIDGGVGRISIILPPGTSIASRVEAGIGSRTISGLEGEEGIYYHLIPDRQVPVISLSVNQGIGDFTMKVADGS